jgi:hypothetical protein
MIRRALRPLRRRSERGAVLVETAICSTFLIIILAGVLEYGNLFGSTIDVASAARSATLTGTQTTDAVVPDSKILAAITQMPGASRTEIQKVVIYNALNPDGMPPAACMTQNSVASNIPCNIYDSGDLTKTDAQLAAKQNWPPLARKVGKDNLGVWVSVKHPRFFNLIPSPTQYTDHFVALIDPQVAASNSNANNNGNVGGQWSNGNTGDPDWKWCGQQQGQTYFAWAGGCETHSTDTGSGNGGVTGNV